MALKLCVLLALAATVSSSPSTNTAPCADTETLNKRMTDLENSLKILVRQHMMLGLSVDEKASTDGGSGIKQVRANSYGSKSYYSETQTGSGVSSIHDHSNYERTIGMGEIAAVLNGAYFRTRHNDYRLYQPSTTSSEFRALEPIALPDVPSSVTSQATVEAEIEEMRQYFKAFATQDPTLRNYKPYFKAVLCYMEGMWIKGDLDLAEVFPSERHWLDAITWQDLEDKISYNMASGGKDRNENHAYLPTKVIGLINGTFPEIARWNYRILCHPLSKDLPLNRLRVVDDVATRMGRGGLSVDELENTRAARFQINPRDNDKFRDMKRKPSFADELMREIPGLDNYGAHLTDNAYNLNTFDAMTGKPLNAANYHRVYKTSGKDASGNQQNVRGYSDQNLFVAMNTQAKIVNATLKNCENKHEECPELKQKWSYAIPLEIVYTTPLTMWNPYDLPYNEDRANAPLEGGRDGLTAETALKGNSKSLFYRTPAEFFTGTNVDSDNADTSLDDFWVEDQLGDAHLVTASGHRILMPDISGVGIVRQRYPIPPIFAESSGVRKEIDALKDVVLNPVANMKMFYEQFNLVGGSSPDAGGSDNANRLYITGASTPASGGHVHRVGINRAKMRRLEAGNLIMVTAEQANGHSHDLRLSAFIDDKDKMHVLIFKCDGEKQMCADGHTGNLSLA